MLEALSGTCQAPTAPSCSTRDCRAPLPVYFRRRAWPCRGVDANPHPKSTSDPGLLGVNAGASFAIVLGARCLVTHPRRNNWRWPSPGRCGLIDCCLYRQSGRRAVKSGGLTLAGVALAAVLEGLTSGIPCLILTSTINCVSGKPVRWISQSTYLKSGADPGADRRSNSLLLSRALNSLSLGSDTATAWAVAWRAHS